MENKYKNLGKVRPTVEGDWNIGKSYKVLSIVFDEASNKSYISIKDVPKGISILNKKYWGRFGNNRTDSDSIVLLSRKNENGDINTYTLEEAINSISIEDRRIGLFISFYEKPIDANSNYRWNMYQFNSNDINDWGNLEAWSSIYYVKTKFFGLQVNEEALYYVRKNPDVGDYAFVGDTLKDAVIYRCYSKNIWKRTEEPAVDYLSIVFKGNITIGSNGNWFQDGIDTGIKAQGPQGEKGDSIKGEKGDTPIMRLNKEEGYVQFGYDGEHWNNLIPITDFIIGNNPDEEDITSDDNNKLKFADRSYNHNNFSGKGYKILRKNIVDEKNVLTQEMINEENTIYEIRYNFDLNGAEIIIPDGCILNFNGGTISNGNIFGNIDNEYLYPEWFGAKGDGIKDDSLAIKNTFSLCQHIILGNKKTYKISTLYQSPNSSYYGYIVMGLIFTNKSLIIEGNNSTFCFSEDVFDVNNRYIRLFNIGVYEQNLIDDIADSCIIEDFNVEIKNITEKNYNQIYGFAISSRNISISNFSYINTDSIKSTCAIAVHSGEKFSISNSTIINNASEKAVGGGIWCMLARTSYFLFSMQNCYSEINNKNEDYNISAYVSDSNTNYIEVELDVRNCIFKSNNTNDGLAFFMSSDVRQIPNFKTTAFFYNCKFNVENGGRKFVVYAQSRTSGNYNFNYVLDNCYIQENQEYKDILLDDSSLYAIFTGSNGVPFNITCNNCIINTNNYILQSKNGNRYGVLTFNNCTINCAALLSYVSNISSSRFLFNINNSIVNINNVEFITTDSENISNSIINLRSEKVYTILGYSSNDYSFVTDKKYNNTVINGHLINYNYDIYPVTIKQIPYSTNNLAVLGLIKENDTNITYMFVSKPFEGERYVFDGINIKSGTRNFIVNSSNLSMYDSSFNEILRCNINIAEYFINKKNIGVTIQRPTDISIGNQYFDTTLKKPIWWTGTEWVDSEGNDADSTPITSGTFANKPTGVDIGYAYFCTDKQTTEGSTNGIIIYHKGEDVWVDALGRVIS